MNRRYVSALLAIVASALFFAVSAPAHAQSTIKRPGDRPAYVFEAEPHLALGLFDPPGWGYGTGLGVGFRGTVELLKNGFIPKLNNSVGIGFGLDYLRYDGWHGPRGYCEERVSGPAGVPICRRISGGGYGDVNYFYVPVVLQWNFWLHKSWSVFGEPGAALYVQDGHFKFDPFVFYVGGRFHFSDRVALTMRLGYPTFSLGVSFLL